MEESKEQIERREMFNQILNDFNKLWEEQGEPNINGWAYVTVDKKNMTRQQYIDFRYK